MKHTLLLCILLILVAPALTAQNYNVSEPEAIQAAREVETSFKKGDATSLSNFFDLNA
jgi:hypothetical protein